MLETNNSKSKVVIKMALLSCAPFVNKCSITAHTAAASVKSAYSAYGKKEESSDGDAVERHIICFTLDNTNVNPKMAHEFDKPMISAYCHCLNLAAKQWLKQSHGALKRFTPYVPKNNETCWQGFQDMAIKYTKIHLALVKTKMYSDLGNDDMEEIKEKGKKIAPELSDNNKL